MKKLVSLLLALALLVSMSSVAFAAKEDFDPELVAAAQAEGELTVYGSCEEPYLAVAAKNFEKEFGITIPDEKAETIQTVGDAINYIEENK